MESAARASGSRFAYLKGDLVRLELALVQYAFAQARPARVPAGDAAGAGARGAAVLDRASCRPTGPRSTRSAGDDLYLVGTSEVSLAALHADQISGRGRAAAALRGLLDLLPARGRAPPGKDTRGIFRVHQFDKVEMFSFVEPRGSRRRARAPARDRGGDPAGARDPVPGRERRGRRPRRVRGEEVRLRGLAAGPGALPGADVVARTRPTTRRGACAPRTARRAAARRARSTRSTGRPSRSAARCSRSWRTTRLPDGGFACFRRRCMPFGAPQQVSGPSAVEVS